MSISVEDQRPYLRRSTANTLSLFPMCYCDPIRGRKQASDDTIVSLSDFVEAHNAKPFFGLCVKSS